MGTTSGSPAPALAIGGVALPSGVTFTDNGNGTGTLSGTPATGSGGTYALTFTASNVVGSSAPQPFTLTINQAPAITSATSIGFTVSAPGSFTVTATGFPAPAITRTGAALPSSLAVNTSLTILANAERVAAGMVRRYRAAYRPATGTGA